MPEGRDGSLSSPWVGMGAAIAAGCVYGLFWGYRAASPYYDRAQGSPGFAAMGIFWTGLQGALLALPVIVGVVYWLTLRRSGIGWAAGCLFLLPPAIAGIVAGFLLSLVLWPT